MYSMKNNGKWDKNFGIKVRYSDRKAVINRMSQCDPRMPNRCPRANPICVRYKVTDANFSNWRYKEYMKLSKGGLALGKTNFWCMTKRAVNKAMQMQRKSGEFYKWFGWRYRISRVRMQKPKTRTRVVYRYRNRIMPRPRTVIRRRHNHLRRSAAGLATSLISAAAFAAAF